MKTRPIPFSAPMVRALLAGTKTQTRRVVKPQPTDARRIDQLIFLTFGNTPAGERVATRCPYGKTGDRLWVREAWRAERAYDALPPRDIPSTSVVGLECGRERWPEPERFGKLRPGMFMPRWASRITLEVTGVRVERLQEISNADARAEGVCGVDWGGGMDYGGDANYLKPYRDLWESINGPRSWDANPWVWIVEFRQQP